jgi:Exo-beta-D-glucosaminidase Ig-fold domain/Glycosyl hydrolases family 2/Glycosyl hydrolases family 2, sugar binding domain/Glycosyl hydrolases family 2, TIM barrel domain
MSFLKERRIAGAGVLFCAALLVVSGCAEKARENAGPVDLSTGWALQDAIKVDAAAKELSLPNYSTSTWHRAVVPGTVLTSLVADGTYPEPLYGENNRPERIPESLCRTSYWYRTEFVVPVVGRDRRVWLNLDGINYAADVWVNGQDVGQMYGAFVRGKFDVTRYVSEGKTAAVAVHIFPPPHPGDPLEQTLANGAGPNGGILAEDGPTFLSTIGWDWIPGIRDRNIGIWRKAWVSESGGVVVENPLVATDLALPGRDAAEVRVEATVRNVTDSAESGVLRGTIDGVHFEIKVSLAPHASRLVQFTPAAFPVLHFQNPRLWWPNGYGPQNLYTLHLEFDQGAAVSDAHDMTFGIRKITYHVAGSDNLTISVNGVPIICKGGDWGMDEAMKRIPRERLEAQIRMHQLANYTMIRNWVGQSTSEDFYDLCDRYGLLIWDEFFQPNPSDGPNPLDTELYLANVREKVLRYRNHPCIAVWCARNEGNPPPAIDAGIAEIMGELEPGRLYQKNSADGRGVRSGGPYAWRQPAQFYVFPASEAFKTELGSVSIPTMEALRAMMPAEDLWPINDDWAEHDLLRGAQQGDRFPQILARRYGASDNVEDFVRKGQLATYEAFRAMYEGRFAKLFRPVTGVITWMSNPAQPSMVWQLYTHDLEPNAALFAVRKACEPLHVQMNQSDWRVMVVNATAEAREHLYVRERVFNLDGTLVLDVDAPTHADPSAATDAGTIAWPPALSPVHFVKLELCDEVGRVLSENFYWRTLKVVRATTASSQPARRGRAVAAEEDFTDLESMAPAAVDVAVTSHAEGAKRVFVATLTNRGSGIALMVHLQMREANGERVLPVYYDDNYVSLLPGEVRVVRMEAAEGTSVAADGWNVARTSVPIRWGRD